jgi:Protein of unknown function, DUF481
MAKFLLVITGLIFSTFAFSQFNDSTHYFFSYASTGIINKTNNSNSYLFSNALRFSTRKKNISLNSANSWIYGWQGSNRTNNDFSSSLDFNLYKTFPHFYYWGLATYDKSYSLKINSRTQEGVGIAYNFIDRKTAYFNISDGILYEASNVNVHDSVNEAYHTLRNSLRVRGRFVIHDIIVLDATSFWQPSFNDGKDYIIKSDMTLSLKIKKWLNITAAASYNKVNHTRRENLLMTFGLTAEKYF